MATADHRIIFGNVEDVLASLSDASVDCAITSPSYWSFEGYGKTVPREIGQEPYPQQYIDRLVSIFGQIKQILKPKGTFWLVLGDGRANQPLLLSTRIAIAMQANGWLLKNDCCWIKESFELEDAKYRLPSVWEHIFLFALQEEHHFNHDAAEGLKDAWTFSVEQFLGARFESLPRALIRRCLELTCPPRGIVLDPFLGSGTTTKVARELGFQSIGIELDLGCIDTICQRLNPQGGLPKDVAFEYHKSSSVCVS